MQRRRQFGTGNLEGEGERERERERGEGESVYIHDINVYFFLSRSFCEYYDMQEHSSRIFSDIINAVGGFIQSYFTAPVSSSVQLPFGITSSASGAINSNTGHTSAMPTFSNRHIHMFSVRGNPLQVESLPANSHIKPAL